MRCRTTWWEKRRPPLEVRSNPTTLLVLPLDEPRWPEGFHDRCVFVIFVVRRLRHPRACAVHARRPRQSLMTRAAASALLVSDIIGGLLPSGCIIVWRWMQYGGDATDTSGNLA